jgi:thermitase
MNRNTFPLHLVLALTLILLAAYAGQVRRWQTSCKKQFESKTTSKFVTFPDNAERELNEYIVKFRKHTSIDRIKNITNRFNDRIEDRFEFVNGLAVIKDEDNASKESVFEEYRSLAEVEYVEQSFPIQLEDPLTYRAVYPEDILSRIPDDPMFADQWALNNTGQKEGRAGADIKAQDAWSKTKGSNKVVVAVLDSGVNYLHTDLHNNIWERPDTVDAYKDTELGTVDDKYGYNAVANNGDPMDENGHGTHCAGIIGAEGDNGIGIVGVNWEVEIMPLKFMNRSGFGTTKDAVEAINYVIDRKRAGVNVRIISASWGSTARSKALEDAIRRAGEEGILFIAASGNSSANADRSPHYPAGYDLPNVISVAALNRHDELASFSNFGVKSVHIAAPGAEILSTWLNDSFEEHSGTSMATPVVSGVAALVLSNEPDLSAKELRDRLFKSVDKLDSLDGKVLTGGRINAAKAVGAM